MVILEASVSQDELDAWRADTTTRTVKGMVMVERDFIEKSLSNLEFFDHESPTATQTNAAKAWGQLDALNDMIRFFDERKVNG